MVTQTTMSGKRVEQTRRGRIVAEHSCDCPDNPGSWTLYEVQWDDGWRTTIHSFSVTDCG